MKSYRIEDAAVIVALKRNGFICEKPQPKLVPGAIHFITRTQEEEDASHWYETDCPVAWNKSYTLPDGTVIHLQGTLLVLLSTAKEQTWHRKTPRPQQ